MLTSKQFREWIADRRRNGATLALIGKELGVSHAAVQRWEAGDRNPSKTVLLLAEVLMRGPREMADGLPGDGRPGVSCPSKGRRDG